MKIERENLAEGHLLLKVTVGQDDYKTAVDKALKEYRRKANVPGFRPGMVPVGMIKKMYGKGVLAEQTYQLASKEAFDYIEKEKIEMLGDLIPSAKQGDLDFDTEGDFEFDFEVGVAPEVKIELGAKDKVDRLVIEPDATMIKNYRDSFLRRFGRLEDAEKATKDEAVMGTLDNEQYNIEDAYVGLISMDDKARKPFIGKKVGDVMEVNVNELYPTASQRASILHLKEEDLASLNPKFKFTITKIRKFVEPELNEEFFKQAFPDGSVASPEAFEAFVLEQISRDLNREAEYVFTFQVRKMLLEKAGLKMPEEFLKQWLFTINEGKFTMEQIGEEFPQFVDMMRWNIIQKYYADKLEVKVEPADALAEAKAYAAMQFAQYGMSNMPEESLEGYAREILKNKDEARKIYDRLFEKKIIEAVAPLIAVNEKRVSPDEFNKIAEKL